MARFHRRVLQGCCLVASTLALAVALVGCGVAASETPITNSDATEQPNAASKVPPATTAPDDTDIPPATTEGAAAPGAYSIPVDSETAAEPALIRQVDEQGGTTFIMVDNVQLTDSDEDGGAWFKNENPRLRTFVLPHDAKFALRSIPEITEHESQNGLPHVVDYDRFRAELGNREPSDWVYEITVREGVVSSITEVYFP